MNIKNSQALNIASFLKSSDKPYAGPLKVSIEVTHRCNSRCRTCNFWEKKSEEEKARELSIDVYHNLLSELKELGTKRVAIVGGEPLLYQDIFKLLKMSKEKGFATSLGTNALLLGNKIDELIEADIDILEISLDGSNETIHDKNRGIEGAFRNVLKTIKEINKRHRHPIVQINITPNNDNILDVLNVAELVQKEKLGILSIEPAHVLNTNLKCPDALIVSEHKYREFETKHLPCLLANYKDILVPPLFYYETLPTYFKSMHDLPKYKCAAGFLFCVIDPAGDVYSCQAKEKIIGSLKSQTFKKIWKSETLYRDRMRIRSGKHQICWLNSVLPMNICLSNIKKVSKWPELAKIAYTEINSRF